MQLHLFELKIIVEMRLNALLTGLYPQVIWDFRNAVKF